MLGGVIVSKINLLEKYSYLIGTTINKWTVLELKNDRRHADAICKCECGTIKPVNIRNLISGNSKDCGCGRKKMLSKTKSKDLTGMRFGKLTVIKALDETNKFNRKVYLCQCDCGNTTYVSSSSLTTNHTLSCGCLTSYYNSYIANFLEELNIEYIAEYRVKIDNCQYRFDFYLPKYNLFIEYDGSQHYNSRFYIGIYKSEEIGIQKFNEAKNRDTIKNEYCKNNGINLLRIPYWQSDNIKTIITDCLQRLNDKGYADESA